MEISSSANILRTGDMMITQCAAAIGAVLGLAIPEPVVKRVSFHPQLAELTLSIIAVESGFDPKATSSAGAKGLMQLTPIAVEDVKQNMFWCVPEGFDYYNSMDNVQVGMCYIQLIKERYDSVPLILATYNGGYKQARRLEKLLTLDTETANYISKVTYLYSLCRENE